MINKLIKIIIFTFVVSSLSGCYSLVVKEDNAPSFETWELCTLLYRPNQMYPNWKVEEEENNTMEIELRKRGIHSSKSCEIIEISKRQCSNYGFSLGSSKHTDCTQETFNDIKDKITQFKEKKTKKKSSGSFLKAVSSGMSGAVKGMNQSIHKSNNEPMQMFKPKPRNIMCPDGKWSYGTSCRMLPDGRWTGTY
jgi:patatin-like phospholipase/acyl hydrolase